MEEATKSYKNCRNCGSSKYVLRLMWTDYYPEGKTFYDDHICLGCGRYVDQSVSLCKDSLLEYRKKYGHIVDYQILKCTMHCSRYKNPCGCDYCKIFHKEQAEKIGRKNE